MRLAKTILLLCTLVLLCGLIAASVFFYLGYTRGQVLAPTETPPQVIIPVAAIPGSATQPPIPSTTSPPNSWYEIYFTSPRYPDDPADHHGGLDEKLTALIEGAQESVDMAIYQFDLPNVLAALKAARQRGVAVRVVTDIDTEGDKEDGAGFKALEGAGIPVVGGNPNAIMHDKFAVVDGQLVWTGSWNFTTNDTYRYNNNAILIRSPELAHNYTVTFEKMFVNKQFGGARRPGGTTAKLMIGGDSVESYFSPEDHVAEKLIAKIKATTKTIDFMAFSFTHDKIAQAILDQAKAGVRVRGVFETSGSESIYSQYKKLLAAKLDVSTDGNRYLMHHKVFILDGKTVVFGSYNFSDNADTENDENLLIVEGDVNLVRAFNAEFAKVYDQAKQPVRAP